MNETELFDRAKSGDKAAFSEIYRQTCKELHKYCRNLCGNDFDADDLMQQVYLTAWKKINQFCGENISSWLRSIARNTFLNNLKKATLQYSSDEEFYEIPEDKALIPENVADRKELCEIILKVLNNCLPPLHRTTVLLYYYDEKSVSEISRIMQCSEGTVKSRLYYARKKLHEEFSKIKNILLYGVPFGFALVRNKLKNLKMPVNARITVSTAFSAAAMTAISVSNAGLLENKLPDTVIKINETAITTSSEMSSGKRISSHTTNSALHTMPEYDDADRFPAEKGSDSAQKLNQQPENTIIEEESTMKKEIITIAAAATMAATGMTATADVAASDMTTETSMTAIEVVSYGDANNDNDISISDSVAISQYVANSDKYPLDGSAAANADVYNPGDGVTGRDAYTIVLLEAGVIDSLPEYPDVEEAPVTTSAEEEIPLETTTAPIRTREFEIDPDCTFILSDNKTRKDIMSAEYHAELFSDRFMQYFNKYFTEENIISDAEFCEKMRLALPCNIFPYMRTELLKIASYELKLDVYGEEVSELQYLTMEKLPDLLRISSLDNHILVDNYVFDECDRIIESEFSEYVTGPYCYTVAIEGGNFKRDTIFTIDDSFCRHYYFKGDDSEENARVAEEIITRVRQAVTEKYGKDKVIEGDVWLGCYGIGHHGEWGFDKRIANPDLFGYDETDIYDGLTSSKNIYFPTDGDPVVYWDKAEEISEIIS